MARVQWQNSGGIVSSVECRQFWQRRSDRAPAPARAAGEPCSWRLNGRPSSRAPSATRIRRDIRHRHELNCAMMEQQGSTAGGSSLRKPRKSRGRGLRTTTGCTICRKRHTKCDEVKPICGPCAKGDRPCTYAPPSAPERRKNTDTANEYNSPDSATSSNQPRASSVSQQSGDHRLPPTPGDSLRASSSKRNNGLPPGDEVAPLKWFGLIAGDSVHGSPDLTSPNMQSDMSASPRHPHCVMDTSTTSPSVVTTSYSEDLALQNATRLLQSSSISPSPASGGSDNVDEHQFWQSPEPMRLTDHEHIIFQRFITGVSLWIDLLDPQKHFSTLVPHMAVRNEGLMKALLALGSRYLSLRLEPGRDTQFDRASAAQYYSETLLYLQSAMRYTSYKNSPELLATTLVVSKYEMIDGVGKGWERHLKGVFWIQRSRNLHGESGGLEQAIWWAWLRQDVWAAFRERRKCFAFFKPTKPLASMEVWDLASHVVYLLSQAINYASDEEKNNGQDDLSGRILSAKNLLTKLDKWRAALGPQFKPLPLPSTPPTIFTPLWIHPSSLATSIQMYHAARILLLVHQPAAGGFIEIKGRDRTIAESVDMIGGVAARLEDEASRLMSTQCLFVAGMYCPDAAKREALAETIREHVAYTGWPSNADLVEELRGEWGKQKGR